MANILPPDRLKRLRKTQWARLLLAFGAVATTLGIIALASLIPSYLTIRLGPRAPESASELKNASSTIAVTEVQNLVTILGPLIATTTTSMEAIRSAVAPHPSGVHIDRIEFSKGTVASTIVIGGVADASSNIEAYRALLAADRRFSQVSVPVNALAGATKGRFAITITGRF